VTVPSAADRAELERLALIIARNREDRHAAAIELARLAGLAPPSHATSLEQNNRFDGWIVPHLLPAAEAEALLPQGLELAPQPLSATETHPVFFMFAHLEGEGVWGTHAHDQLIVAVPYVEVKIPQATYQGPFLYLSRVYRASDSPLAQVMATLYGWEEHPVRFEGEVGAREQRAIDPESNLTVLEARFVEAGGPRPPGDIRELETVRKLLDMPTIAQAARVHDAQAFYRRELLPTDFLCSSMRFHFDDPRTRVAPVEAQLYWHDVRAPEQSHRPFVAAPLGPSAMLGAFRLRTTCTTSGPTSWVQQREFRPAPPVHRQKVAILGGGPAACAAAFYLAQQKDRYEIDIYTQGWRLGGKCAAGRNARAANRIEEHGIHAFLGFYQNAFRTIREVYRTIDLPLDCDGVPFGKAFSGRLKVGLMDRHQDCWQYFRTPQEYNLRVPGEIPTDTRWDYPPFSSIFLLKALASLRQRIEAFFGNHHIPRFGDGRSPHRLAERSILRRVRHYLGISSETKIDEIVLHYLNRFEDQRLDAFVDHIRRNTKRVRLLSQTLKIFRRWLRDTHKSDPNPSETAAFHWSCSDVALTGIIGVIDERVLDFGELDDRDLRQWLLSHGLARENANCAGLTQVYMTLFANDDDVPEPDHLAAGVGLRWFFLIGFLYTGYPAYEFRYSSPETIFSPYYHALTSMGVRFHFFHHVQGFDIEDTPDGLALQGVRLQPQARPLAGSAGYDPLMRDFPKNPPGHEPWPSEPKWDLLERGDELRARGVNFEDVWGTWDTELQPIRLERGRDFDVCISGIPLAVMPKLAPDLFDPYSPLYSRPWAAMAKTATVTRPVSAQLWAKQCASELYSWDLGLMTGYEAPEPSFGEFSHLIEREGWPADNTPKFCAYHTGARVSIPLLHAYPDANPDADGRLSRAWRDDFEAWLGKHYRRLYDRSPHTLDEFLACLSVPEERGQLGVERLREQYFHVSVQPSDLYNLSPPGSTRFRLGQADSRCNYLLLCGDWTKTDLNCGCVEAATQSGMFAARALSNRPSYVWRVGF